MPKLTESQIKAALSVRDKETREDSKLRKALSARIQASRRPGEKALVSYLKKTEFDFKAYDRIRAQHRNEMQRLFKKAQQASTKRASSRKKELAYGVESWRKNVERLRESTLVSQFVPALRSSILPS
jgi:hypothetical protein